VIAEELAPEALARFDGAMREYAYQRNAEFERALGPQLVKTLVDRMGVALERGGKLKRELGPGDVARVAEAALKHLGHHLTMSASLEDVTSLARNAAREFRSLKLVGADADLFADAPNSWDAALAVVRGALGEAPPTFFTRLRGEVERRRRELWVEHVRQLNAELAARGCETYTRIAIEESLGRARVRGPQLLAYLEQVRRFRSHPPAIGHAGHHEGRHVLAPPDVAPQPELKALQEALAGELRRRASLHRSETPELADAGGELDRTLQMPGWANVWTRPIQNRVDMLFTGVNTDVGVRVLGRKLDDVVRSSEEIAAVLKGVSGAADVMAETVRGKGYLEIRVDRDKASRAGASVADVNEVVEIAFGGKVATSTVEGRERHDVRVRYQRMWRDDEEAIKRLRVPLRASAEPRATESGEAAAEHSVARYVELAEVADVRIAEGPATIKSENGLLRNYVRLNVRGRSAVDFVDEARRVVAERVRLPEGVYLEWTGQFEHDAQAVNTLLLVSPLVVGLILLILYWTYHDLADAVLMLLTVPGAMAGGVLFQWLLGYDFSVTVLVGYIACFGMATSTGIIMLVYLREAIDKRGGLENIQSLEELRQAVIEGAVHRLRPKLLTEGVAIIAIFPMVFAKGVGGEILAPMALPVLGGLLISDEVVDLFLPVRFYWVRRTRWLKLQEERAANQRKFHSAAILQPERVYT
jgi:Cu(I)/Ag(I) efflux system membrane protein CusA/SilA